jgi:hypothetical protein
MRSEERQSPELFPYIRLIALTGLRKLDDIACEHVLGEVTEIKQSERHQGHFECKAHDPDRLWVELVAIQVGPDWHGGRMGQNSLPAMKAISNVHRLYRH